MGDLRQADRPLLYIPVWLCTAAGLIFGLMRCVLAVRENLQNSPSGFGAVAFLIAIFGCVALVITLFSAAVGFLIGTVLQAGHDRWRARKKLARAAAGQG